MQGRTRPASAKPLPCTPTAETEPEQLLATLRNIIQFLGEVYAQASGHSAAAHRVVTDLRRSLAYLNRRREAAASGKLPLDAAATDPSGHTTPQHRQSLQRQPSSSQHLGPTPSLLAAASAATLGSPSTPAAAATSTASAAGVSHTPTASHTSQATPPQGSTPGSSALRAGRPQGGEDTGSGTKPSAGLGSRGTGLATGRGSPSARPGAGVGAGAGGAGRAPAGRGTPSSTPLGAQRGAPARGTAAGPAAGSAAGAAAARSASTGRVRPGRPGASPAAPGAAAGLPSARAGQRAGLLGRSKTPEPPARAAAAREAQATPALSGGGAGTEAARPAAAAEQRPSQGQGQGPLGRPPSPSPSAQQQPQQLQQPQQPRQAAPITWPPHMPAPWRRAVKQYEEALAAARLSVPPGATAATAATAATLDGSTRSDQLQHHPSVQPSAAADSSGAGAGAVQLSAGAAAGDGAAPAAQSLGLALGSHGELTSTLSSSVSTAAQAFSSRLQAYSDAAAGRDGPSAAEAATAAAAAAAAAAGSKTDPVLEAQRAFAAVVAAQTWVLNALRQSPPMQTQSQAQGPSQGQGQGQGPPRRGPALSTAAGQTQAAAEVSALGISAEGLHQLLLDLRVARLQLGEVVEESQRRLKEREQQQQQGELQGGGQGRGAGQRQGQGSRQRPAPAAAEGSPFGMTPSAPVMPPDVVQAALRWRNRFLRGMAAPLQRQGQGHAPGQGQQGGRQGSGFGSAEGRGGRPGTHPGDLDRGPRAGGVLGAGGRHASSPGAPHHQGQAGEADAGSDLQLMPQPLGLWLPQRCWSPAVNAALARPPDAGEGAAASPATPVVFRSTPPSPSGISRFGAGGGGPSSSPAGWVALAPWLTALPSTVRSGASPPPLVCPSIQHGISHGRAMQQLQQCLMHLYLEGSLAKALLPFRVPPNGPAASGSRRSPSASVALRRVASAGSGRAASSHARWEAEQCFREEERFLARCRLAHTFLIKGSWNRRCFMVEPLEVQHGDAGEGEGGDAVVQ